MKTEQQIRAAARRIEVVVGKPELTIDEDATARLCLDLLLWVLGEDRNGNFAWFLESDTPRIEIRAVTRKPS